ncbi:MAG: response regulator transcription factor [Myxococcota bacterium]
MQASATRNLFLVDDHPVVRSGLQQLIDIHPGFTVSGEASSAEEALEQLEKPGVTVDLLVTDLRMGQLSGIDLTRLVKTRRPELPVLLLSSFDESLHAEHALEAGASGYIMKDAIVDVLFDAMESAVDGGIWLSDSMWDRLLPPHARGSVELTAEERALVHALSGVPGPVRAVAARLGQPTDRVQAGIVALMQKLRLFSPLQVRLWAHRANAA